MIPIPSMRVEQKENNFTSTHWCDIASRHLKEIVTKVVSRSFVECFFYAPVAKST